MAIDENAEFVNKILEESETSVKQSAEDIPWPYVIYKNELYKLGEKGSGENKVETKTSISRDIPRISARLEDIESDNTYYLLEFENIKKGTKKLKQVKSKSISVSRDIVELSQSGFSINSNNASEIVSYLDRYESHNDIPVKKAVDRLGYIKGHLIHPLRQDEHYIVESNEYERVIKAFRTKGTLDSYLEKVFNPLKEHKTPMFLLLSSLSSVLMQELDVEPTVVDLSGNTSQGKTVAAKTALSVWGDSNDLIIEWNATQVAIERNAYFLNSYPLVIDDTMKAEDDKKIGRVIYNHSSGHTKSRGTITGITAVKDFRNILISTGEKSAADIANKEGGAAARVITLQDKPFPDDYDFNLHFKNMSENFGHLGLEFIDQYNENKQKYKDYYINTMKYYSELSDIPVVKRLSRPFAVIHTGGKILCDIDNINFTADELSDVMNHTFKSMLKTNKNLDKPLQRLNDTLEMINGRRHQVHKISGQENRQGFIAYVKKEFIGIDPSFLDTIMDRAERLKIVAEWKVRGYLINDSDKNTKKITVQTANPTNNESKITERPLVIAVKREVFEEQGYKFDEAEDMYELNAHKKDGVIPFKHR